MINLTSTDSLTLATSAIGAISVHVSWIDQIGTTITPGRTNTASITTIATTTILSSPAASTLRNAKFISIFNTHASVSNTLTLQHTDGTNAIQLTLVTLAPNESITWDETRAWERLNSNGIPITLGQTGPVDVQTFTTASANWVKPTAFVPTQVLVKLWGSGGGGGGGGSVAFATACKGGAGGGGGACAIKYFLSSELTATVVVGLGSAGTGGTGGINVAGNPGGNGNISTFGGYLSAYGGGGGGGGAQAVTATPTGAGGGTGTAAVTTTAGLPAGGFDGGGGGVVASVPQISEFGGNAGVSTTATPAFTGVSTGIFSIFGGSGGGNAGYRTASGSAIGPNSTQQACGRAPGGAGVTGAVPTAGAAGAAGNSIWGGSGGGAGGNSNNAAVNGGAGGAGGQGGGGGGGGGLTIASNAGGAGGNGGRGYCVVISW